MNILATNYATSGGHAQRNQVGATAAEPMSWHERVEWGPVWAGVLVALPTFLVLQLLFVAFGWLDLGINGRGSGTAAGIVSAVLALVGFLVGGLLAGRSASRTEANNGLLHGVLVWALGVTATLAAALLGGGALLGSFGASASQLTNLQQQIAQNPGGASAMAGMQAVQHGAGWSALWLGLAIIAAAIGGVVGALSQNRQARP